MAPSFTALHGVPEDVGRGGAGQVSLGPRRLCGKEQVDLPEMEQRIIDIGPHATVMGPDAAEQIEERLPFTAKEP